MLPQSFVSRHELSNWSESPRPPLGKLTNDEIEQIDGDRKQLEGKIQERYGHSKEEAERAVENWLSKQ
ncbi:MAG: CsbD family protein [Pseudomonadota bacterium]